jgi:sialic acid synthase SpsE
VSGYPAPPEDYNLRTIADMRRRFATPVGLSDHTLDVVTSIAAVALGAVCVEKHFTLSKRLYGPDHHASLEPDELAQLVAGVRTAFAALGSGHKGRDSAHDAVRATFEKSVVTRVRVAAGTPLEPSMLTTKRPGTGIPAVRIASLAGRTTSRDVEANVALLEDDLV